MDLSSSSREIYKENSLKVTDLSKDYDEKSKDRLWNWSEID